MNKEEEKIYMFNEYVLGYDKGRNDRSCLTISKIQNGNMYVMSSLYDGSAEIISTILDNFQQELERYKNIVDEAIKELETLLPLCIMPNNTLIHATEKSKTINKTLNILKGE